MYELQADFSKDVTISIEYKKQSPINLEHVFI